LAFIAAGVSPSSAPGNHTSSPRTDDGYYYTCSVLVPRHNNNFATRVSIIRSARQLVCVCVCESVKNSIFSSGPLLHKTRLLAEPTMVVCTYTGTYRAYTSGFILMISCVVIARVYSLTEMCTYTCFYIYIPCFYTNIYCEYPYLYTCILTYIYIVPTSDIDNNGHAHCSYIQTQYDIGTVLYTYYVREECVRCSAAETDRCLTRGTNPRAYKLIT